MDIVCVCIVMVIAGCAIGGLEQLGDRVAEEAEAYRNGHHQ